jgi:hypothetical protein
MRPFGSDVHLPKGRVSRTVDAPGIGIVLMHNPDAADFCEFCKHHPVEIVGRRLNSDRLSFVQTFVFPRSHMELLPVREAKKEQAEYEAQMKKEAKWAEPEEKDEGLASQSNNILD